ncbi:hypothetical protein JQC72_08730 [Polycladomyces sp. WAk]|uniref:Uncharacterized protein n=1 Tax=Polycladomyces zharkentensis TaxID=2807616 RepID=A0ABS2WJ78_9BACL|nr:hypothetical protein [Polycladomyces sp. WAk]MBN2909610.1 hypothetical protein [Polycladomyces sp. WAk]
MKTRVTAAILSLVVTLFLLFGGYFAYQWWALKKPIEAMLTNEPHFQLVELRIEPDRVWIKANTDAAFSFTTQFPDLNKRVKNMVGERAVTIQLADKPDPVLNRAWNRMVFDIEEGLVNARYSQIPKSVETVAKSMQIRYDITMDDQFLYVELHRGPHTLYRVLPLHKSNSGVKDNG